MKILILLTCLFVTIAGSKAAIPTSGIGPETQFTRELKTNANAGGWVTKLLAAGSGITISSNIISLYVAPQILTFSNNRNSIEAGSTVTSVLLTWTINGTTVTTQHLSHGIGSLPTAMRSTNHVESFSTNRTYNLIIGDGSNNTNATTSVTFLSPNYYGVSANSSLDDAQVLALAGYVLSTTRVQSFVLSPSSEYLYVAYPASYGAATFTINGFTDTAWTLVTRDVVNASGYSQSYNIYRSNDTGIGTFTVGVN